MICAFAINPKANKTATIDNRLDIDGMHRKQRCHHKAPPGIAGCTPQHPKEQHRVQGMKKHAGLVVSGGILIVHLEIQRVRQPGNRVPVTGIVGDEGPAHGLPREAALDVKVLGDINIVVVIDERMAFDGIVKGNAKDDQKERKGVRTHA